MDGEREEQDEVGIASPAPTPVTLNTQVTWGAISYTVDMKVDSIPVLIDQVRAIMMSFVEDYP